MDWNGRRITAIVENALLEDRATSDATSYACIDPSLRAGGTIVAKQDCILAGVGCVPRILDVYAALDGAVTSHYEVTSHPEVFDGVRLHDRQTIAVIRHNARVVITIDVLNYAGTINYEGGAFRHTAHAQSDLRQEGIVVCTIHVRDFVFVVA